jgi:hypothetical protein
VIALSLVAGALGIAVSRLALARLARRREPPEPTVAWILGLAGPLPGWVVAFLGLLGAAAEPIGPIRLAFVASSAGGLLGAIVTDVLVRRLRESAPERPSTVYWLLGLLAIAPGWAIALLGLRWAR